MRLKKIALAVSGLALVLFVLGVSAQEEPGFKLVIHSDNPTSGVRSKVVARMFEKRIPRWEEWEENGEKVVVIPIDREPKAEVRRAFSKAIHGKSPSALESYWIRQVFSGRDYPPDQLASDQEVLDFVRTHRGAIGYVSSDAELGQSVKELTVDGG